MIISWSRWSSHEWAPKILRRSWWSSEYVEKASKACFQLSGRSASIAEASTGSDAVRVSSVLYPYRTHRKRLPAAYCVKELRHSSCEIGRLPWTTVPEGMRAVAAGGNSTTSFRVLRMRCPPRNGSKEPMLVIAHQPFGLFALSTCSCVTTLGPKLKATEGNTLLLNGGSSSGWWLKIPFRMST